MMGSTPFQLNLHHLKHLLETTQWHSRLGHPSLQLVHQILSHNSLPVSTRDPPSPSSSCCQAKSSQQPFRDFHQHLTKPLQLIYSNV